MNRNGVYHTILGVLDEMRGYTSDTPSAKAVRIRSSNLEHHEEFYGYK